MTPASCLRGTRYPGRRIFACRSRPSSRLRPLTSPASRGCPTTLHSEQCLLIPTERLLEVAVDGGDRWVLNFHPESPERTPLDPFRLALSDLGRHITEVMQAEAKKS